MAIIKRGFAEGGRRSAMRKIYVIMEKILISAVFFQFSSFQTPYCSYGKEDN